MSENENATGFGLGIIVGAAIGLAIGFLYAPKPGKETRALLKGKVEETKVKAEEIIEEAKERAKKIIEDAKGKAAEIQGKEQEPG